MSSVLEVLNPRQREAVTAPEGSLLVLAGAGSGKTRTIAHRIAFLIRERRVPAPCILALTFTNKAAGEMRARVLGLLDKEREGGQDVWIVTFHALALRLLRRYGEDIGLKRGFTLFDEEDRRTLLRRVIRELGLVEREYPVSRVGAAVSARKNAAFDASHRYESPRDKPVLDRIATTYQSLLESQGGVDFDDLLIRSVELLECSERARDFAARRFQHVLVDEYQDTNRVQYRMLRLLAPHGNLFVVGDEDQSIYNFRGADLRNILDFERDFPQARVVKLEQNYRSSSAILEAANSLIAHNRERKGKRLVASRPEGEPPRVYPAASDLDEAAFVGRRIETLRQEAPGVSMAVLFRTHAQSRLFEEELVRRGVPYVLVGGRRFYERREVKDALGYLRLAVNPNDDPSFLRVINVPTRGVGAASVALLEQESRRLGTPLWEVVRTRAGDLPLPARALRGLQTFAEFVESLSTNAERRSPSELLAEILEKSGLLQALARESSAEAESRRENLRQLLAAAAEFEERDPQATAAGFLDNVGLLTGIDTVREEAPCLLMTLHSAKGLEFDAVFLTGLEEGLFPHLRSAGSARAIEEERRLCYVGMTRARSQLFLTYAESRRAVLEREGRRPSRFLAEMNPELLTFDALSVKTAFVSSARKTSPERGGGTAAVRSRLRPGTLVRHPRFGEGTVREVDFDGGDEKVTVSFARAGRKRLVLRYANLEVLAPSRPP